MKKFNLTSFLVENKLTRLGKLSEGYMGTEYESSEDMAVDMAKKGMYEEETEVEEDYSKYESVEELMKEIETSTNEAAMKHKMERVKKAYESMESKATSLEEGEHASFIAPAKIKEMKRGAKELRKMHERLLKEYEKKFASKKKVDLNEAEGSDSEFTMSAEDVVAAAGTQPLRVYKRGGRVHTYDNVQDFLDFFHKNEPGVVYKQERPGVFAAIDAPMEPGKGAPISTEPVDYQAGVQSFYDRLKYKGD